VFRQITAGHAPAGTGGKASCRLQAKINVPAMIEEEDLTAAVVWLAGEIRTAEPANTGMAATLKDGMHFG